MIPKPSMTPEQATALEAVRAAAQTYVDARKALAEADAQRTRVIRDNWEVLHEVGPTRIERELNGLIREGTVRTLTRDLRAAHRTHED